MFWAAIVGKEMASLFQRTRVNINVIDDTNFPSANMRFFEIPTAGGVQVSSPCPDMEEEFLDGRHLMYYNSMEQLAEKVELLLNDPVLCDSMRRCFTRANRVKAQLRFEVTQHFEVCGGSR